MIISLQHTRTKEARIDGFYIPSSRPEDWLAVLEEYQIALQDIYCYEMPMAIDDIKTSGLFVVLQEGISSKKQTFRHPYYRYGDTMYVPLSATLFPPVTQEEVNELSQYHVQCFHPTIGLVGWEKEEQLLWDTITCQLEYKETDWSLATYESLEIPTIKNLVIQAPDTEKEVVDMLEKEVEKEDLSSIPLDEDEQLSLKDKIVGKLGTPILKGLLKFLQFSQGAGSTSRSYSSKKSGSPVKIEPSSLKGGSASLGFVDRFEDWLKKNIEELERRQQKELNKLLKMLDEDPSEALKYAIPLGGDELGRGKDMPSYKLTRNNVNFNMGSMSNGVSDYGWNIGNHYYELRRKYIENANKEVENKNFRKAAYIYAHLLKDFHNAANVLEQGGYYKEAATLYLEKLNNKETAATCYEKGMHYNEAIEIHKELKNYEKTGDLYELLHDEDLSKEYYVIASEVQLKKQDYLDAARIQKQKLADTKASKNILLKGWKSSFNAEACLSNYFSESYEEEPETLSFILDSVYKNHTSRDKESQLLNVLYKSPRRDFNIEEKSTDIAYKIISKKLLTGRSQDIHKLKSFVEDKTLEGDINRFMSNAPRKKKETAPIDFFLDANMTWTEGVKHKNQLLFLGHNETHRYIARVNKYKNIEYVTLKNKYDSNTRVALVNNPIYSDTVLVIYHSDTATLTENITLYKNKYFEDIVYIKSSPKLKNNASYAVHTDAYFSIQHHGERYQIEKYNSDLDLMSVLDLKKETVISNDLDFKNQKVIYRDDYLFTFNDMCFYVIHENTGKVYMIHLHTSIKGFDVLSSKNILIKTYSGLLILKFESDTFTTIIPYFSKDFFGNKAFFLGSNKVIHYSKTEVNIFTIEQEEVNISRTFTIDDIICCLPMSRNAFSVLTDNRNIKIYEI